MKCRCHVETLGACGALHCTWARSANELPVARGDKESVRRAPCANDRMVTSFFNGNNDVNFCVCLLVCLVV